MVGVDVVFVMSVVHRVVVGFFEVGFTDVGFAVLVGFWVGFRVGFRVGCRVVGLGVGLPVGIAVGGGVLNRTSEENLAGITSNVWPGYCQATAKLSLPPQSFIRASQDKEAKNRSRRSSIA